MTQLRVNDYRERAKYEQPARTQPGLATDAEIDRDDRDRAATVNPGR